MNWAVSAGLVPVSGPFIDNSSNSFLGHCQPQIAFLVSNMLCPDPLVWPCKKPCLPFILCLHVLGSNWAGSSLAYARLEHRPVVRIFWWSVSE